MLQEIKEKYDGFDASGYLDNMPQDGAQLAGTVLDGFLREVHAVLAKSDIRVCKVDFIGMAQTSFYSPECGTDRTVNAYFDIVWVDYFRLETYPVLLQSKRC